MPWNAPIGLPNCWRVFACSTERASAAPATPTRSAAAASSGVASADSRSTGATATGSASISTSATGWAGSVHSASCTVTPSPTRTTTTTGPSADEARRDDQFGAGETGHRDGASLHAPALQRHRYAGQARARRMNRQRGDDAAADLGQHISDGRTGLTQQHPRPGRRWTAAGRAPGPHRTPREPRSGPSGRTNCRCRGRTPASSVQPRSTTVFHSVRQRSGSVMACRATVGGHSVRRTSRTLSRSANCPEFSPTSIRPLT